MPCSDLAYQYDKPYLEVAGREEHARAVGTKASEPRAQRISRYLLAVWHEQRKLGLEVDPDKARELYGLARESGHHWACGKGKGGLRSGRATPMSPAFLG